MIPLDELTELVRKAPTPSYLNIPTDFDILLIADSHFNPEIRKHLARNIQEIKSLGVASYGCEASVSHAPEHQRISQSRGVYIAPQGALFGPINEQSFRDLAYASAKEGLNLYPFDPIKDRIDLDKSEAEKVMATTIEEHVDKVGKGLVLVGGFHIQRGHGYFIGKLESDGYRCATVIYHGGKTEGKHLVEIAAQRAGRQNDAFMLKNLDHRVPPGHEYIIHLPQEIQLDNPFANLTQLLTYR